MTIGNRKQDHGPNYVELIERSNDTGNPNPNQVRYPIEYTQGPNAARENERNEIL